MSNAPQGRRRNVTGTAGVGGRKGSGLGTGPVGNRPTGMGGGSSGGSGNGGGSRGGGQRNGGGMSPIMLIIAVLVVLLGGGGGLSGLFGGGSDTGDSYVPTVTAYTQQAQATATRRPTVTATPTRRPAATATPTRKPTATATRKPTATATRQPTTAQAPQSGAAFSLWDLIGGGASGTSYTGGTVSSTGSANSGDSTRLDRTVASGARAKYTKLKGNGKDTVTLMIYMCGADLESRSSMASRDLQEIAKASYGDNVRVIVYTGGSTQWHIRGISNQVNQIWRVQDGKLMSLSDNEGASSMTNPDNLSAFIRYASKNYPASRYCLILWDHGGGSVSGYGYDEKYRNTGSMTLPGIQRALKAGGVKFDFIGFDACLMATVETALMCADYADYLIASEETEPGIGWYYTDWLTSLGRNTSIATIDLGKEICDSFVSACAQQARGQKTTLSVTDLAELSLTIPDTLRDFSKSVTSMVKEGEYKQVSNARYGAREFAASTKIDQVDLSDLANRIGGDEAAALTAAIDGAVKYNRAASLTGAYGLSIYFPYQKTANVNKAANAYASIGMDDSYAECIRAFASLESSGQAAMGGTSSPYASLSGFGSGYSGGYSSGYSASSGDSISALLDLFLGGGSSSGSLFGRAMEGEALETYLADNALDGAELRFTDENGRKVLRLSAEQWALVHDVDLNLFLDDGEGYVDLGLDNVFDADDRGGLLADTSGAWITLNGQLVAYYREAAGNGESWGYIPVLLDGERAELIVYYTDNTGFQAAGIRRVYKDGETETVAKADELEAISAQSVLQPIVDFYHYDGTYDDSYRFGREISCDAGLTVSEGYIPAEYRLLCTYRLTDIYQRAWWTEAYQVN